MGPESKTRLNQVPQLPGGSAVVQTLRRPTCIQKTVRPSIRPIKRRAMPTTPPTIPASKLGVTNTFIFPIDKRPEALAAFSLTTWAKPLEAKSSSSTSSESAEKHSLPLTVPSCDDGWLHPSQSTRSGGRLSEEGVTSSSTWCMTEARNLD